MSGDAAHSRAVLDVLDRVDAFSAPADEPPLGDGDVRALADISDAEGALVALAGDTGETPARRYAAAEALLQGQFDGWRSSPGAASAVASAMAVALREDASHNRWGLPGHFAGRLGEQLLSLSDGVVEALAALLDDRARLRIEGSEAATLDEQASYRIADLAAYLISRHQGSPWEAPVEVGARDDFIAALKAGLGSS